MVRQGREQSQISSGPSGRTDLEPDPESDFGSRAGSECRPEPSSVELVPVLNSVRCLRYSTSRSQTRPVSEVLLKVKLQQQDDKQQQSDLSELCSPQWHINPDTSSIKEEDEEDEEDEEGQKHGGASQQVPPPSARPESSSLPPSSSSSSSSASSSSKQSWLLRLFESMLFDVPMAISTCTSF
ncbi:phosphatidylinositol 4-kinase beta-like protein [Lates japonicus]|uniref:Phosphatidylinositol 4-kinase beta-like protein n=1 Tax=Lates japonicus TaxID=270547 RepID=A0AAD3NC03_LATJO|nr:phosphatidylinositol 4-kinase beta-like protein [Lates japonicus]